MDSAVRLLFADPRTEVLEEDDGVWVVSGVDPARLASVLADAPTVEAARSALPEVAEDAVVAHVAYGSGGPVRDRRRFLHSHVGRQDLFSRKLNTGNLESCAALGSFCDANLPIVAFHHLLNDAQPEASPVFAS